MNNSYFLITTSDENTWKFDRNALFLGEWCRLYDRKHVWDNMRAVVAEPYGMNSKQKVSDDIYASEIASDLLPKISTLLNNHHGIDFEVRLWNILIGHWLRRYVRIMINRTKTILKCLDSYSISSTICYSDDAYNLATIDCKSILYAADDEIWNNVLFSKILRNIKGFSGEIEYIGHPGINQYIWKGYNSSYRDVPIQWNPTKKNILKRYIKKLIENSYSCISKILCNKNDVFITKGYFSSFNLFLIQLYEKQFIQFWPEEYLNIDSNINASLRHSLQRNIYFESKDIVKSIIYSNIFSLLPICFLEGFKILKKQSLSVKWPKNPKYIFTCNHFVDDEIFKYWTADKIRYKKTPYYVGQHGNTYGTYRYDYPSVEEITSDAFLTWGWKDNLTQHIPGFVFKKPILKNKKNNDKNGNVLLVAQNLGTSVETFDVYNQYIGYWNNQFSFIDSLHKPIKQKLLVRLFYKSSFNEVRRINDFDNKINIDEGNRPINYLLQNSRIALCTFDTTLVIELFYINYPVICFWKTPLNEVRDSAKPYYERLIKAGILYDNAISAAAKVNEIFDNVDLWWKQEEVQSSVKYFCSRFAKKRENISLNICRELNNLK